MIMARHDRNSGCQQSGEEICQSFQMLFAMYEMNMYIRTHTCMNTTCLYNAQHGIKWPVIDSTISHKSATLEKGYKDNKYRFL